MSSEQAELTEEQALGAIHEFSTQNRTTGAECETYAGREEAQIGESRTTQ